MKEIIVYNKEENINHKKYNFIIKELWFENWYRTKRRRPKMYEIKENNKTILHTSLHQTYYKYKRNILLGVNN